MIKAVLGSRKECSQFLVQLGLIFYPALFVFFLSPSIYVPLCPLHICFNSFLFFSPPLSLCSLTEHGGKYKASIFIRVSERHPVSLLLGNTGECSCSLRLADHSCAWALPVYGCMALNI